MDNFSLNGCDVNKIIIQDEVYETCLAVLCACLYLFIISIAQTIFICLLLVAIAKTCL